MGRVKTRPLLSEDEREKSISNALKGFNSGRFPSIRKAAEHYGISHATLSRQLNGSKPCIQAHADQQLLTPAEERSIVRWILQIEEWGFPPRLAHVKEAVALLRGVRFAEQIDANVSPGKNWITRFLDRHPELVAKFSSQFDKKRLQANDPDIISDHFRRIAAVRRKYGITDSRTFNMDEKGFRQGISDRAKVICQRRPRGTTGKVAQDGNKELVTVIETISGNGTVLPPLIIFKGKQFSMGWFQITSRNPKLELACKGWKISYSISGWTNSTIALSWVEHFDALTRDDCPAGAYRLLILDGHGSHITVEFVEYCLSHYIVVYCLPAHSTHLLQPLDVGLFSPLQKAYTSRVDHAVRYGAVTINKSNFFPILQEARGA